MITIVTIVFSIILILVNYYFRTMFNHMDIKVKRLNIKIEKLSLRIEMLEFIKEIKENEKKV